MDATPYGFLINSIVNTYIQKRPLLLPCEAQLFAAEHLFLRYDSWVDCRDIYPFTISELTDLRGNLSARARQIVLQSVDFCPVLKRRFKKLIQG